MRPIRVIPIDQTETRFRLERRVEAEEEKIQPGYRPALAEKRETDKKLDLERLDCKGDNRETILVEDEKLNGGTHLDEDSSSDDWKESFEQLGPGLPILNDPLPTGVAYCLTRFLLPNFTQFLCWIQNISYFYSTSLG